MNAPHLDELDATLRERGVVSAKAPPLPEDPRAHRPWYIGFMQGTAGWFAGVMVLVFLFAFLDVDSPVGFLLSGIPLIVAAYLFYSTDHAFVDQLALSFSMAGQLSIAAALGDGSDSPALTCAGLLVLQCLLLAVMPDRLARMLAAFFACIAWALTLQLATHGDEVKAIAPWGDGNDGYMSGFAELVVWMLTWAPLVALASWLARHESRWMATHWRDMARPALSGILSGICIGAAITEPFAWAVFGSAAVSDGSVQRAMWPLASVGLALFAGFTAFRLRSNGLLGFAILAALAHMGRFYYHLGISLTLKAAIMLVMGLCLLGAAHVYRRAEAA